jgi:hypothetical protein
VKRILIPAAVLAVLGILAWVGVTIMANVGVDVSLNTPGDRPRAGACTPADPCEIRFAFAYTQSATRDLPPGLLIRVAREDLKAFRKALRISGVLQGRPGQPNIQIVQPVVLDRAIDARQASRVDQPAGWRDPVGFNQRMLQWLPTTKALEPTARKVNVVVILTGLRGANGDCYANAASGDGYIVIPACLLDGYATDPKVVLGHHIMFLHEAGHIFGAFHNDAGDPQPCREATRSGKDPTSCAWEQCTGRTCTAEELRFAPDAFCTLVGQYNYKRAPGGCRAHTGGYQASGWIMEFSHPGKCNSPGYEAYDCGDANHDAVSAIRRAAPRVAAKGPSIN